MKRREFNRLSAMGALAALTGCSSPAPLARVSDSLQEERSEGGIIIHPYDSELMKGHPATPEQLVTLSNYHEPDRLVWFHQHVRELFPTQVIAGGGAPVSELPRASEDINGMSVPAGELDGPKEDESTSLIGFLRDTDTDAFLVVKGGKVISEQYFSGMKPETPHYLWSMSKSISVGVLANLLAEGAINRTTTITEYLPELRATAYQGATVQHLLDMTASVDYSNVFSEPFGSPVLRTSQTIQAQNHRAQGYFPLIEGESPEGAYGFMLKLKQKADRDHGELMFYKDPDSFALAWACERVKEKRFADLLSEYVWSKLGVEHDASLQCDPVGGPIAASGISATARDVARWGQMHLQGGQWNGKEVVPREFIVDIQNHFDDSTITTESHLPKPGLPGGTVYRNQFWRFPSPVREKFSEFAASGMYGQHCYIHPETETVIVKFSSHQTGGLERVRWEFRVFGDLVRQLEA